MTRPNGKRDRLPTAHWFYQDRAIEKGQTFELSHAHIPQTQYNITSKNNAFYFQEQDTGTHLITLDPGHYSPTSLVEALKAKMNAVVSNPVTITISSTTFKITISSAGNFRVLMAVLTTPCKPLGFNTDRPYGLSHTADKFLDLEVESSLSIDINDMFEFDALDHGATFNIPIDVDILQVLDYTPPSISSKQSPSTNPPRHFAFG